MPRKQTKPKPTEGQPSLFDGIVPDDVDDMAHMDVPGVSRNVSPEDVATMDEFEHQVEQAVDRLAKGMLFEYRTDRRGYILLLERDLFGLFVLHRYWFGLYNRKGAIKRQVFEREQDALKEARRIMRRRERHGYALVNWSWRVS